MNIRVSKLAAAALVAAVALAGCSKSPEPSAESNAALQAPVPEGMVRGRVLETMDAGGYTYVSIETEEGPRWIASRQASVDVGDVVQTTEGMPMRDFTSPSLGRTFEVVYFSSTLQNLSHPGDQAALPHTPSPADLAKAGAPSAVAEADEPVEEAAGETAEARVEGAIEEAVEEAGGETVEEPVAGTPAGEPGEGQDIASVYANREALAGQQVSLRGEVVKYNGAIMGYNWLHIQDGSGDAEQGNHDIAVTTQDTAAVGDTVTITGTLSLGKDFGSGYQFPLLIEDAKIDVD